MVGKKGGAKLTRLVSGCLNGYFRFKSFLMELDMSEKTKRPVGRPSELTPDVIECAWGYVRGGFRDVPNRVPSVAGLAFVLGKSRECLYEWARQNQEFSDILEAISSTQEMMLLDGGLSGDFNPTITKLMMTKHGYSDKVETDVSSKGQSITPTIIELVAADAQK